MKKQNLLFSGILIAIGIPVFFMAKTFPPSSNGVYGPGFFPQVLAVILVFLSILLVITSKKTTDDINFFSQDCLRSYAAMGILTLYIILINIIGFVIVTPFFLFGLMRFLQVKRISVMICISLGLTATLYFIFTLLLYVQLPDGILF